MNDQAELVPSTGIEIAIIGMAGRFPGAPNIDAFWKNVREGVESVSFFTDQELQARGVPETVLRDPDYVKAGIILEGVDQFDAEFFGYSPREAEAIDPQHRLFLETAWEALEHAGYAGAASPHAIGVYAGTGANTYLLLNLLPENGLTGAQDIASLLSLMSGNDKDSLATRVCYKLNLKGPGVTVQTACSTSLVAVHLACRGLLNHEADMALAGGVWVNLLQQSGYRYQSGAILSPDGHCRAFDARAAGTVVGSGVGVVVLKRLADALTEGDTIHGIIKGSAVNNDGSDKVGYTAPSVEGQREAILAAQAIAEVPADTISYVEAHGTGTTLGDPIEMTALTQAFEASTPRRGFCAIGSVKTNIGHLDAAAGVTGLIKTVMALKHRTLPPSLHFEQPNPQIDFSNSAFYINTSARDWPGGPSPRRAGVSSFGIGGTNAHVILEEAPAPTPSGPSRPWQILTLSARSRPALEQTTLRLRDHLKENPHLALPDVAYTLQTGRKHFTHRTAVICRDPTEALKALETPTSACFLSRAAASECPPVAFLFPGQGAQYVGMAHDLYHSEPVFRRQLDHCAALLQPHLGVDLRDIIYPREEAEAAAQLEQTAITQPALFIIEYALARLWMSWGIYPEAMIGHSIGEYVAACLAGVFSLEEVLSLVAARGRLLQALPPGAMLAVMATEAQIQPYLHRGCDLAAVNGEGLCVLSGPPEAIDAVEQALKCRGVAVRRLRVSHAFHSAMVEPMLAAFVDLLKKIELRPPKLRFLSNVSGHWITAQEATDPDYWAGHLRRTVRFAEGLDRLLDDSERLLLEVGPGETLTTLARRHPKAAPERELISSLPHPDRRHSAPAHMIRSLGRLWLAGAAINWKGFYAEERRRRVPLPTYPFEGQRYWVEPAVLSSPLRESGERALADWFYTPSWKRAEAAVPLDGCCAPQTGLQIVLSDAHRLGTALMQRLRAQGYTVIEVAPGDEFARPDPYHYRIRPGTRDGYDRLIEGILELGTRVGRIFHLWNLTPEGKKRSLAEHQSRGFFSLLYFAQAWGRIKTAEAASPQVPLIVVTNQLEEVSGDEPLCPEKATLLGPCRVIPQEYPQLVCRVVDVDFPRSHRAAEAWLVDQIFTEADIQCPDTVIAYRGRYRWKQTFESVRRDAPRKLPLRPAGVYLITGGLGDIGLTLARHLAKTQQAKLVLVGRSEFPPRDRWPELVAVVDLPTPLRSKMQQLMEFESWGAEVLVWQADIAREAQLRTAIEQARQRFGALHGVIHAAGEPGGGMIAWKTAERMENVFAPKIQGTRALQAALENETLDFVLFCSSLTAIVGGPGQSDYCAANLYLDAAARAWARRSSFPVLSVNWGSWREVGMAARFFSSGSREGEGFSRELGIAPHQGVEAFERVLGGPATPQVIVSPVAIEDQAAFIQSLVSTQSLPPSAPAPKRVHARPPLSTAYQEPSNEVEHGLAERWESVLGIHPVGVNDSLFELGGDSLVAIQLLSRLKADYGVELSPADFLENPTIAALAVLIEAKLIEEIVQK